MITGRGGWWAGVRSANRRGTRQIVVRLDREQPAGSLLTEEDAALDEVRHPRAAVTAVDSPAATSGPEDRGQSVRSASGG